MMSKHLLWALLALELLTLSLGIQEIHNEDPEAIKNLGPFLSIDNDISDDVNAQAKSEWLEKQNKIELEDLNDILDVENEYLDEEDDVVLWRAVVTSLAEWNYKKMLSKKNGREKRDKEPVCYQYVGCFLNDGPYSHLSHPSSPEEIDTKFYLYTGVKEEPDLISYMNLTSIRTSSFNASHVIKIIIHGFGSSCRRIWAKEMRHALLTVDDPNVICVDWEKGASLPNYPRATSNTRLVGRQVAILVNKIHEIFGTNNSMVHLIGFSLGAHVSGYAGAELRNVSRITGLDPAGPMFENQDTEARLDKTDGAFVDVIHSNGESLIMGGLGAWAPMGHIDFYPNGGRMQKGCTNLFLGAVTDIIFSSTPGDGRSLCNHRRAYKFFTDSVVPKCLFPAFPCENYDKFLAGECFPCSDDKCGNMGYYADKSPGSGIMYLATREEEPFCANQFKVMIYSSYNYPEAVSRGKVEIAFMRDEEYPDVFYMTKGPDEELRSGGKMVRMVVAHPLQDLPTKIRLIYTAYNGWLSSGLAYWSIDKLVITDSFGKNASYCKTGLVLPSGVSTTITLNQGDCIPVFYDVYAPNRDQIWKSADMNNKVVNLYGDVNIVDPKLQLLDPSTGRVLQLNANATHRFSDTNNTAYVYSYAPIDLSAIEKHANVKVARSRLPSFRFISSLQRHFRSKSKGVPAVRHELYPPPVRPIQEIPLDYKDQGPERNQTFEPYPQPRPHPQLVRPPARGEQITPVFGPNQPQHVVHTQHQPLRVAPEQRPAETIYVQAPGESPFQNKGTLQEYFVQDQSGNPEKMNGRREVTKHLGHELYLENTSVKYVDQYYGQSEVQNYAQNYDYSSVDDTDPSFEQKDEVADYDIVKSDFTSKGVKNDLKPEQTDGFGDNGFMPLRYETLNSDTSAQKPDLVSDLKGTLLHQTENTLIYRQSDGLVKMIFMPNQTSEYDDQIVSFTERDDILGDEFEYYDDEEYDEVPGAQLLTNDRLDDDSQTVLVSTNSLDQKPDNVTSHAKNVSVKVDIEKTSVTKTEAKPNLAETKPNLPVQIETYPARNSSETKSDSTEVRTDPTYKMADIGYNASETKGNKQNLTETAVPSSTEKAANSTESKTEFAATKKTGSSTAVKSEPTPVFTPEKVSSSNEVKAVASQEKAAGVTENRTDSTSVVKSINEDPKEQALSLQLTNNVKRNINVQLNVNRLDLTNSSNSTKTPTNLREDIIQPENKTKLNSSTTNLNPVPSSTPELKGDPLGVRQRDERLTSPSLPPPTASSSPRSNTSDILSASSNPPKVIIPATPVEILLNSTSTNSTSNLTITPSRRAKGSSLDRREPARKPPITIMASVELTTTAPATAAELPDNSSLIAQFVNLGQADIRRSKSRAQESSRRENPLLVSADPRKNVTDPRKNVTVRGRDLKNGNNTGNNLPDSRYKTELTTSTVSSLVETQTTNLTKVSATLSAPGSPATSALTPSAPSQPASFQAGSFTSSAPSTESAVSRSTSTASPRTTPPSAGRQVPHNRDSNRNSQVPTAAQNVTADATPEKSFPEIPVTLIKFKAEDRVTERTKKINKEPALPQYWPAEVVMAVQPEMPPELPLAQRVPEVTTPVAVEVPQQHRLPEAFVTVPLEYRQPEVVADPSVAHMVVPSHLPVEDTSFVEPTPPRLPSEFTNPFGIPVERLTGVPRPAAISSPFGVPKTGSGVPLSPTATSRRNILAKRPKLVYKPTEVRPQPIPQDGRHTFVPLPDEIRSDNTALMLDEPATADRADYSKIRTNEEWGVVPPGVRLSRFDEHQRHLVETAKLQTLSRDLIPPPVEFEEQNRRRSRLYRYGSWIPNIWSYINPFGGKQDEPDPKSSNSGWMTYIWGQPGVPAQGPPPLLTPAVSQQARAVPVSRNFKVRNRVRTFETGAPTADYIPAAV